MATKVTEQTIQQRNGAQVYRIAVLQPDHGFPAPSTGYLYDLSQL
jgi:hypothetical protein